MIIIEDMPKKRALQHYEEVQQVFRESQQQQAEQQARLYLEVTHIIDDPICDVTWKISGLPLRVELARQVQDRLANSKNMTDEEFELSLLPQFYLTHPQQHQGHDPADSACADPDRHRR